MDLAARTQPENTVEYNLIGCRKIFALMSGFTLLALISNELCRKVI